MRYLYLLIVSATVIVSGCGYFVATTTSDSDPAQEIAETFYKGYVDPLFESTAGAKAIALGDINNDGLTDVASISSESQPVQIHLRNATTGKFDLVSIAGGGPLAIMEDVALADFNGDGKLDIAVLVNDTGLAVPQDWQEDQIGAFVLLIQGTDPRNPADWTQVDSYLAYVQDPLCALESPGTSSCDMFMLAGTDGVTDMEVADFTNDGLPDAMVICNRRDQADDPATKYVYLFPNPGAALADDDANWHRTIVATDAPDFARLGSADLDEDGSLDAILTMPTGKSFNISWLRNIANGTLWDRVFLAQHQNGGNVIAVGDIDNDGHADVAAGSAELMSVQWFRNPGPAWLQFGSPQIPWDVFNLALIEGGQVDQVQLVDLNADGNLDCFLTAEGTAYAYYRTADIEQAWTGSAIFRTDPAGTIGRVGFLDVDNIGLIDIIAPVDRDGVAQDQIVIFWR